MTIVTDPQLIKQLNAMRDQDMAKSSSEVTDPQLIEELNRRREQQMNPGFLSKLGSGVIRIAEDIDIGANKMGRNMARLLHLPGGGMTDEQISSIWGQKNQEPSLADKMIQGLAQYAPAFVAPGANLGRAGQAIGSIPKVGGYLAETASQAIPQAAFGATQEENPLQGAAQGAIGAGIGTAIGKGIESSVNALRPSRMFKTPLSNKELAQSNRQAEGTNMDLGNIIQNPKLQRYYENKLPKKTGDVSLMQQKTGQQIVDKGESILNTLLGKHSPENVPSQLTKMLTESFNTHQKFKTDIYNAVDDLAQKEGLKLELPLFSNEAKKYMDAIEGTNILKHEPDAKQIMSKLINYKTPIKETTKTGLLVDKSGNPLLNETTTEFPTLKEANILKGKLGQYAKSYGKSSDADQRHMAGIFKNLAAKLKGDIKNSIEKSGNELLKKGYNTAEENFAKNYSPFLDKDVYKFISGQSDPETIVSKFITNSKTSDLGGKLSKLAEKLSKPKGTQGSEGSNLLAYGYLSRALDNEGNFNPAKFATAIKNLGPNQLKALFPDKAIRKDVLNYKALVNKNPRSLAVMHNPLTGQVNSDIHPHVLSNVIGGLSGLASGGAPGAILGAAAGPLISSKLAKLATKKLSDPKYRREFINALIANKDFKMPKGLAKAGAVSAGLGYGNEPMELELIGGRRE